MTQQPDGGGHASEEIAALRARIESLEKSRTRIYAVGTAIAVALVIVFGVEPRRVAREIVADEVKRRLGEDTLVAITKSRATAESASEIADDFAAKAKKSAEGIAKGEIIVTKVTLRGGDNQPYCVLQGDSMVFCDAKDNRLVALESQAMNEVDKECRFPRLVLTAAGTHCLLRAGSSDAHGKHHARIEVMEFDGDGKSAAIDNRFGVHNHAKGDWLFGFDEQSTSLKRNKP